MDGPGYRGVTLVSVEAFRVSRYGRDDTDGAFEIVGDGGETDLCDGFGKSTPSHPTKAIAALASSEDLLDATTNSMDRFVPCIETVKRLFDNPLKIGVDRDSSLRCGRQRAVA